MGTVLARFGLLDNYKVTPGLYAIGIPDAKSPVIVTGNYKLRFDTVRKNLGGCNAWILVVESQRHDAWCATARGIFSTEEVIRSVQEAKLEKLLKHRKIIVPQLAASTVAAHQVEKACGFSITWGTVRVEDMREFLDYHCKADPHMRMVTFTLSERVVLVPVALWTAIKSVVPALGIWLLLSCVGAGDFSFTVLFAKMQAVLWATGLGILSGTVLFPLALIYMPCRCFAANGALLGAIFSYSLTFLLGAFSPAALVAMMLWCVTISSFFSMRFTGAAPFTSPSGVEQEIRRFIPILGVLCLCSVVLWLWAAFA